MVKNLVFAWCALLALSASAHADSLPNTMLGNWCAVEGSEDLYVRKACPDSDGTLTVRQNEYVFWESGCDIKGVQRQAKGAYLVHGSCSGEGTYWTAKSEFKITGNRLSIRVVSSTDPIPDIELKGPSFNCANAKLPDEVLICQHEDLAAKDRYLAVAYAWAMSHPKKETQAEVRRSQTDWLKQRRNCRYDVACINTLYDNRIAQLQAFGQSAR